MLFDDIRSRANYKDTPLGPALEALAGIDLYRLPESGVVLEQPGLKVSVLRQNSTYRDEKRYEAHRRFIDIHMTVSGVEYIDVAHIGDLTTHKAYDADKDIEFFGTSPAAAHCALTPGRFLVCYPNDAHMPGLCDQKPDTFVKLIAKIPVDVEIR